jgi:hypothetical protein
MPGFGPFESYTHALMAACPLILSKPNATAGRVGSQDFQVRWRVSSEYCAWLYYTPEHKYEMSMLTDQAKPNLGDKKTCDLPPFVDDPRYPPSSLKYVFALHNHPFEDSFSDSDIRRIVDYGVLHGFEADTKLKKVHLGIIAFFSRSADPTHPTCDGFFEYVPGVGELLKWTQHQGNWVPESLGTVEWLNASEYRIHRK